MGLLNALIYLRDISSMPFFARQSVSSFGTLSAGRPGALNSLRDNTPNLVDRCLVNTDHYKCSFKLTFYK